ITPQVTVGPRITSVNLKNDQATISEHKILIYGLEGRYFTQNANTDSMYLLGGVVMANVTTQAKFAGTAGGSGSSSSAGPLAGIGYQAMANGLGETGKVLFNFGALYGHGYTVGAIASSKGGGPTVVSDMEVRSGLFLEASIGMLF
ncbi:MAG: hypothetical protein V4736_09450, partial [Bdellovibrionota bacterium]